MEKIVISIEDMASILEKSFEEDCDCVANEFCSICKFMNNGCPVGEDVHCPHEKIVEYRYFVMQHFRPFMVKE